MTTTVQEFIKDKLPVVAVTLSDALVTVSKRMIEHDFSQMPVVDADNKPVGIITSDSILKALNNYGTALKNIRIKHAMLKRPQLFKQDIDLLDLFDDMEDACVLIVDDDGRLVQVITSHDTAEYFRQRANDILLVENIENTLKDYIQLAFSSQHNGETKLDLAIQSMTNSTLALSQKFEKSIRSYLGSLPEGEKASFHSDLVKQIFAKHFDDKQSLATFDDLTLAHYISLFLHKDHWSRLEEVFELNKEAVTNMLESVRLTRNALSHFRDISRDQGYQLRDCYDLLVSHQPEILRTFAPYEAEVEDEIIVDEVVSVEHPHPIDDEPAPGDSRYAPLAIWLQSQPADKELIKPTFAKIEEIIDGKLPESAYKNRAWWANDSVGHIQSKQWLDVGWRVASVNMTTQVVRFAPIVERQKAYIDFFSALINELRQQPGFNYLQNRPDGVNWYWTRGVSVRNRGIATFNYSFGRGGIFRIELYIDCGDQTLNKQIYDGLVAQKEEIEAEVGHELTWQRLDDRRASRIARIFKGHITDSKEELAELRQKTIPAMINYVKVIQPRIEAVGKEIL